MTARTRDDLVALTAAFLDAFNRNDLDAVVAAMAPDGVYEEFDGTCSRGRDAVRAALEPQFTGAFGDMRFDDEDLVVDEIAGKVMASWRCSLEVRGRRTAWRGLDALTFGGDGLVTRKLTYAKAKVPLFDEDSTVP